ncbi:hypothetical protein OH76DRAFT_1245226 [Lentinus brumalis]|uniref:mRNA 3'-end-processing protein RNA14 n=1 Tax=Lentinus brumalis TaxID=2498619 RepID=A0A371CS16_9APHY|nr:hypothetical protein OH76DRAFT_1245226 [Polyporus brumalis]
MTESSPSDPMLQDPPESAKSDGDQNHLTENILNALRQLQQSGSPVPPTPTQQSSQETQVSLTKQETTPQPQSEWERLRAQLREKPVDADSWLKLVDLAEESGDIEKIKDTYEGMLEIYPNTPSVQIAYLQHFLDDPTQYNYAETLFKKFLLRTTPSVELLKFYLTYIRRITKGPNAREVIQKCYDFALSHASQDKDSYDIWQDYINFLKAGETKTTWEEQQKMDAVRRAYQQAVQIPMENVKRLWEDYQDFENGLNKITAKKFISDLQESHMQARTVYNQLQDHLSVLFPPTPPPKGKRPAIWLPRPPTFNSGDKTLLARWRQYLKWEESNPLLIEESNKNTCVQRRVSGYSECYKLPAPLVQAAPRSSPPRCLPPGRSRHPSEPAGRRPRRVLSRKNPHLRASQLPLENMAFLHRTCPQPPPSVRSPTHRRNRDELPAEYQHRHS